MFHISKTSLAYVDFYTISRVVINALIFLQSKSYGILAEPDIAYRLTDCFRLVQALPISAISINGEFSYYVFFAYLQTLGGDCLATATVCCLLVLETVVENLLIAASTDVPHLPACRCSCTRIPALRTQCGLTATATRPRFATVDSWINSI